MCSMTATVTGTSPDREILAGETEGKRAGAGAGIGVGINTRVGMYRTTTTFSVRSVSFFRVHGPYFRPHFWWVEVNRRRCGFCFSFLFFYRIRRSLLSVFEQDSMWRPPCPLRPVGGEPFTLWFIRVSSRASSPAWIISCSRTVLLAPSDTRAYKAPLYHFVPLRGCVSAHYLPL